MDYIADQPDDEGLARAAEDLVDFIETADETQPMYRLDLAEHIRKVREWL